MRLPVPVPLGGLGRVTSRGTVRPGNHAPDRGVLRSGELSGAVFGPTGDIARSCSRFREAGESRTFSGYLQSWGSRAGSGCRGAGGAVNRAELSSYRGSRPGLCHGADPCGRIRQDPSVAVGLLASQSDPSFLAASLRRVEWVSTIDDAGERIFRLISNTLWITRLFDAFSPSCVRGSR